jgi:(E)-4-hydroxy-3-methylbut-2-enyl-diphosphate synthase
MARAVEKKFAGFNLPIKIAVMGCEVNGPGEAKEADIGIAGSKNIGVIFKRGKIIRKCPKAVLLEEFCKEVYSVKDS